MKNAPLDSFNGTAYKLALVAAVIMFALASFRKASDSRPDESGEFALIPALTAALVGGALALFIGRVFLYGSQHFPGGAWIKWSFLAAILSLLFYGVNRAVDAIWGKSVGTDITGLLMLACVALLVWRLLVLWNMVFPDSFSQIYQGILPK